MTNDNNPIDNHEDMSAKEVRRRRGPRRDGKGSNARANEEALANQDIIAVDEAAEKAGGAKLIGNRRIIPFMKLEIPMMIISALLVIASIVAISVKGLNLGLDFTGGVSADVSYAQPVEQAQVTTALANQGFNDAVVQYLGTRNELLVRLPPHSIIKNLTKISIG